MIILRGIGGMYRGNKSIKTGQKYYSEWPIMFLSFSYLTNTIGHTL